MSVELVCRLSHVNGHTETAHVRSLVKGAQILTMGSKDTDFGYMSLPFNLQIIKKLTNT